MKDIFTPEFDKHAIDHPLVGRPKEGDGGFYKIPLKNHKGKTTWMFVQASIGGGWDHVSISIGHRCPNWFEMQFIKNMFFEDSDIVMQLHVPESDHINLHHYCLHLWKPQNDKIPLPPIYMV